MKKMMVLFLLVAGISGETVLAGDNDHVSRYAKDSFNYRFPNAGSVTWNHLKDADLYHTIVVF